MSLNDPCLDAPPPFLRGRAYRCFRCGLFSGLSVRADSTKFTDVIRLHPNPVKFPRFARPRTSVPLGFALVCIGALFCGCSRESKLDRLVHRADEFFRAGNFEAARIEYQNVLQVDSKHAGALRQLGGIWLERGAPFSAAAFIEPLRRQNPGDRDAQEKALRIAQAGGQLDVVWRIANGLLAQFPNHPEAIMALTEAARGKEELKAAQQALKKFTEQATGAFHRASANLALRDGNLVEAKSALQKAVANEPKSVDAHLALGNFYLSSKETAEAGKHFKIASELAPLRSNARVRYLEFQAQTGAVTEAIAGLKEVTKQAPDFFPAWRSLAQLSAGSGKYDEAQAFLNSIFALDNSNYEARIMRSQILRAKGEIPQAIAELETLAGKYPTLAGVHYELARSHLQNKDTAKALAALKKTITLNADHDLATLLWADLTLRSGDAKAVVLAMGDLLAKRPSLGAAQMLLIDAMGALGRLDDITTILTESLRVAPERPQTHHLLGLVLVRKGKTAEARQAFEKTLELAPDSILTLAELVTLDLKEKDVPAAKRRVEQRLQKNPESGPLHLLSAKVYAAEGRWDETEAAAWKAIDRGSGTRDSFELIARSYIARKDKDPRARVEALLTSRPKDVSALVVAGDVYMQLKEFSKAADAYEKCLTIKPDTITALNNLSFLYTERLNNPDRGFELATKARALDPNSPEIADTLGWILFNRREYAGALELLKESAARLPGNPEVQFHLARANQMLGNVDQARAAYQKAATATRDFEGKTEIKNYLAQLDAQPKTP